MEIQFYSWRGAVLKSSLPSTTKHVLLTLGCHMNDVGESCFPSIEMLAEETSLSRQSVMTHLQLAKDSGWIVSEAHGYRGQKWARNEYRASMPEIPQGGQPVLPPLAENLEKAVNVVNEGGQRGVQKAVNHVDSSSSINNPVSIPEKPSVATQSQPTEKISFDSAEKRFQIPMRCYDAWEKVFPKLDLDLEIDKAELWLAANLSRRKKNYERFLLGWFTRAAENAKPKVFIPHPHPGMRR